MAKGAPSNSRRRRRSEREGERSKARKFSRSSLSSLQHSKKMSFKAEDEIIFSDLTNNILNLASDSMNDFSSSLFDSYEIKALSKYVLSLNPPATYNDDGGVGGKSLVFLIMSAFPVPVCEGLDSAAEAERGGSCMSGFL